MVDPDEDLVRRAKAGDLEAFETLVRAHEQRVYTLARRILQHEEDAQDVTQQTFLGAMEHLGGFRGEARFSTWLLRLAAHAAFKVLRKRRRWVEPEASEPADGEGYGGIPHPEMIADWRESPVELARRRETGRLIEAALAELEEKYRVIFVLRDVEGFSVKETAEALGLSEANVKVRLLRARLQLRERLTREFGDPARRLEPHGHGPEGVVPGGV